MRIDNRSSIRSVNKLIEYIVTNLRDCEILDKNFNEARMLHQHNYTLPVNYKDKPAILKVYDQEYPDSYYSELDALKKLKSVLPVPDVFSYGQIALEGDNYNYIIMDVIRGRSIFDIVNSGETISSSVFFEVGSYLKLIKENFVYEDHYLSDSFDNNSNFGHFYFNRLYSRCSELLKKMTPDHNLIWNQLKLLSDFNLSPKSTVVTFDCRQKHIFINENKVSGFIDFEFTKKFDPAIDIAILFHDILLNHSIGTARQYINAIIKGYFEGAIASTSLQKRILFYMARQGIIHSTTMYKRYVKSNLVQAEMDLIVYYLSQRNLNFILENHC